MAWPSGIFFFYVSRFWRHVTKIAQVTFSFLHTSCDTRFALGITKLKFNNSNILSLDLIPLCFIVSKIGSRTAVSHNKFYSSRQHMLHSWKQKTYFMSLAILFHFLCAQHVSDINILIIRSLRLFCWIITLAVCSWFDVLVFRCECVGVVSVLQASAYIRMSHHPNRTTPKHQNTSNQEHTTNVIIQQNSRKLLIMDILMSKTCWAHKKWNKITSDIKLIFCFQLLQWCTVQ